MDKVRSLITSPILEIKPFVLKKAAVITTGSEVYKGRIQDTFTPVFKLNWLSLVVKWCIMRFVMMTIKW